MTVVAKEAKSKKSKVTEEVKAIEIGAIEVATTSTGEVKGSSELVLSFNDDHHAKVSSDDYFAYMSGRGYERDIVVGVHDADDAFKSDVLTQTLKHRERLQEKGMPAPVKTECDTDNIDITVSIDAGGHSVVSSFYNHRPAMQNAVQYQSQCEKHWKS